MKLKETLINKNIKLTKDFVKLMKIKKQLEFQNEKLKDAVGILSVFIIFMALLSCATIILSVI